MGIPAKEIHETRDFIVELAPLLEDETVDVVFIGERLYARYFTEILRLKRTHARPLLVAIPDSQDPVLENLMERQVRSILGAM